MKIKIEVETNPWEAIPTSLEGLISELSKITPKPEQGKCFTVSNEKITIPAEPEQDKDEDMYEKLDKIQSKLDQVIRLISGFTH